MIKKGLSLEEAFKALNGRAKVNETEINETEEEKRINELKNLTFKDLDRDEIYFSEYGYGDDLRIKVRGNKARFSSPGAWDSFTNVIDPNERVIDYLAKADDFNADDPETWPFVIEDVEYPSKINENKKQLKEEFFEDFPKLTDLAKGEVFTAYFGNHESCDFSYDSTKDTLIQKYYDPADTFKYKNIKTQADFEKVIKDDLGDGKITWEKKESKKLKESNTKESFWVAGITHNSPSIINISKFPENVKTDAIYDDFTPGFEFTCKIEPIRAGRKTLLTNNDETIFALWENVTDSEWEQEIKNSYSRTGSEIEGICDFTARAQRDLKINNAEDLLNWVKDFIANSEVDGDSSFQYVWITPEYASEMEEE